MRQVQFPLYMTFQFMPMQARKSTIWLLKFLGGQMLKWR